MKDLGVLGLLSWPLDWDLSSMLLHAHSQTYMPTCIHTYIRACMCMCIYIHTCTYIYIYTNVYIHTLIYTYTYISVNIYIYTYTHLVYYACLLRPRPAVEVCEGPRRRGGALRPEPWDVRFSVYILLKVDCSLL